MIACPLSHPPSSNAGAAQSSGGGSVPLKYRQVESSATKVVSGCTVVVLVDMPTSSTIVMPRPESPRWSSDSD